MRTHKFALLSLAAVLGIVGLVGCGKKDVPRPVSEAEQFSNQILNARFSEHEGRWIALEKRGTNQKPRLVELNKPAFDLSALNVSETDQMNGVTERYTLSIFSEQTRYWDGSWSEWKKGTGSQGTNAFAHALTGGTLGYQHFLFEKKNGKWAITSAKQPILLADPNLLAQFSAAAFGKN